MTTTVTNAKGEVISSTTTTASSAQSSIIRRQHGLGVDGLSGERLGLSAGKGFFL